MRYFTSVADVPDVSALVSEALECRKNPFTSRALGRNKTIGLIFFNPSLRTRLSTQKAAMNLGMDVIVMNADKDSWKLEMQDGTVMNGTSVEHIREAAGVMGQYFDILALRSFPQLEDRDYDYSEEILNKFIQFSGLPVISLESATRHPLQSLADLVSIRRMAPAERKIKVVLSWAPHIKPLPQAVPNSFAEWVSGYEDIEFVITHPEGYELHTDFSKGATISYDQAQALEDADFIYVKNWSSFNDYGKILHDGKDWMLTHKKLDALAGNAKVMHCLPVRRGLELADEILDGPRSMVLEQASNRVFAAQAVLKRILEANYGEEQYALAEISGNNY